MTEVPINQKEYLKKYLAIGKAPGEKKKKKKKPTTNRIQIIDDDAEITMSNTTISNDDPIIIDEDAPQIVAIIDERPPSLRIDEKTKNPLWQPIGSISDDNAVEQKQMIRAFKIEPKTTEKPFLRPDKSPPRRKKRTNEDNSPPRRSKSGEPSWKDVLVKEEPISEHGSPPRRYEEVEDVSPPRKSRDSDASPPRKSRFSRVEDNSPPRRKRRIDEDASPPRKNRDRSRSGSKYNDNSPPRRQKRVDGDFSPSRRNRDSVDRSRSRGKYDNSPPRRNKEKYASPPRKSREERDFSPPRRNKDDTRNVRSSTVDASPPRRPRKEDKEERGKKMTKTLDGKAAGLQNARELIEETKSFHSRENQLFQSLPKDVSGETAQTVHRNRKTGKIRNLEEEQEHQRKKREEEEKNKEKYARWGRGLAQVENREQQIKEQLHEMSKPLARYADDEDLEKFLKEQERDGDPMLAYLRKKKRKKAVDAGVAFKPQFEGEFMPNRYGIRPGHRWDGVDRSSGYEKKWFDVQNEKKAIQEDIYRWSTEDM